MSDYKLGYVLPVGEPIRRIDGGLIYKNKETGELHKGWFHCGCCDEEGFQSMYEPCLCTGCSNKIRFNMTYQSPVSVEEINKYVAWTHELMERQV